MRNLLAIALFCIGTSSEAAEPRSVIVSDIEMSKWTPPMRLRLDLKSGRYAVAAPSSPWPAHQPRPRPRSGALRGEPLKRIRAAAPSTISLGFVDRRCASGEADLDIAVSNGGTPYLTVTAGRKTLSTARNLSCRSAAALRLHSLLSDMFDGKNP